MLKRQAIIPGFAKKGLETHSWCGALNKAMDILNAEPGDYSREAYSILNSLGNVIEEECSRERLLLLIPDIDVLIVRLRHSVDNEVFSKAKKLKIVVTATTGLNHIDLDAAADYGVTVLSLRGERDFLDTLTATAELTWALLLTLVRHVPQAIEHVNDGGWNRDQFKGSQLKGKTLGIIGYGRLGTIVAEYGKVFQMDVKVSDPYVDAIPTWIEKLELDDLLASSDVISLHVPFNRATINLLDKAKIDVFKRRSVFINTSRGELIDEDALISSLESGHIKAAGLDVIKGEVDMSLISQKGKALINYAKTNANLIIVPHIGGATEESMSDAEIFMASKLRKTINA
jgi:D-3-phosphoglycerate dehydrogenase / 2-oxoglutarate reductase